MARGGNSPVIVPANTKVILSGAVVRIEGPGGKLQMDIPFGVKVEATETQVNVIKENEEAQTKANQGTVRAKINSMVKGVTEQFVKTLVIEGVGFKAALEGTKITLLLGFSHPVIRIIPTGITASIEKNTIITLKSANKESLGDFAAQLRKIKIPDPYKAKGIRYADEHIRRKAGKTAGGATAGGK